MTVYVDVLQEAERWEANSSVERGAETLVEAVSEEGGWAFIPDQRGNDGENNRADYPVGAARIFASLRCSGIRFVTFWSHSWDKRQGNSGSACHSGGG